MSGSVLSENIKALMSASSTIKNATELGVACEINQTTVNRILAGTNSPTLKTLDAIARAFNVQVWQLLAPGLNPKKLPAIESDQSWPMTRVPKSRFTSLPSDSQLIVQGILLKAIADEEAMNMERLGNSKAA